MKSSTVPVRKLRILCFHGYQQNAKDFAGKLGSLRKALKSRAELIFIDAPHLVKADDSISEPCASESRAWWTWQDPDVAGRPSLASTYTGVEASLQLATNALSQHQPIDGVLGFSQGSALASLLLAQCQNQGSDTRIKFAILAGAFLPKDPKYAKHLRETAVHVPTLFVCGESDKYIPLGRTKELIETFDQQRVQQYVHTGGHMVPTCTGDFKRCLQTFLDAQETL